MSLNNASNMRNIDYVAEDNYSIIAKETDVWHGSLPFKTGDKFPTDAIKERALISNTNRLIFNNDVDRIYRSILSIFPEIEPMFGWQVREIIADLPYFKNSVNYWVGLIAGEPPVIDGDENIDLKINEIIENCNWSDSIQNEVRSRFMDVVSAYRVDRDLYGKASIIAIDTKNLICYVNDTHINSIEVNVVFNIYTDKDGLKYVEFIEYHYDGKIVKTTFEYNDDTLGAKVDDKCEEGVAFNGKYELSPVVVFKHNAVSNEIYGTDQFRYWQASIVGAMRELQNIFRLGERTREMIRKVPSSAVKKDNVTGSSVFYNKGTISYPDETDKIPEISYAIPEIPMEQAIKAFEKAIKSVSIDTNLGPVFFDLEKLGTNLSAKSIEAALYPTKLEAKRITTEMRTSVKELVIRLAALADLDITSNAKFSIIWYDGFPQDIKDYTDAIQRRLGGVPSISLQDGIMKLDKVSSRVALQKAREIELKMHKDDTVKVNNTTLAKIEDAIETNVEDEVNDVSTHDIAPIAGEDGDTNICGNNYVDDAVWETQMYPSPAEKKLNKGVIRAWLASLRKRK